MQVLDTFFTVVHLAFPLQNIFVCNPDRSELLTRRDERWSVGRNNRGWSAVANHDIHYTARLHANKMLISTGVAGTIDATNVLYSTE